MAEGMNNLYAVLHDFTSDGLRYLRDENGNVEEFYKVDFALKRALEVNYGVPFEIVKRVKYEAVER